MNKQKGSTNIAVFGPEFEAQQAAMKKMYDAQERLREAAPDLLASLREFVELYDGVRDSLGTSVRQKLARADAAIAKAGAQ